MWYFWVRFVLEKPKLAWNLQNPARRTGAWRFRRKIGPQSILKPAQFPPHVTPKSSFWFCYTSPHDSLFPMLAGGIAGPRLDREDQWCGEQLARCFDCRARRPREKNSGLGQRITWHDSAVY